MKLTRRDFIRNNAIAATAAAAGLAVPASVSTAVASGADGVRWDKAPCRFCGTGCSVLVGTKEGRVVATQGDPEAPVNKGLNCIKGYFLGKILYGADRLTTPLLAQENAANITRTANSNLSPGMKPLTSWPKNSKPP